LKESISFFLFDYPDFDLHETVSLVRICRRAGRYGAGDNLSDLIAQDVFQYKLRRGRHCRERDIPSSGLIPHAFTTFIIGKREQEILGALAKRGNSQRFANPI
jgi:hypothetical protein